MMGIIFLIDSNRYSVGARRNLRNRIYDKSVVLFAVVTGNNIKPVTYFEKRRKLLPENSVIQEKECKAFLEKTCDFYLGNGFIFACEVYKGELYIKEYLGDKTLIPLVLQTMGYRKGYIRTPEGEKSFAMSLSLCGKENPDNVYFGFALD